LKLETNSNKKEMEAKKFAKEWIDSWNSHDLEDIMKHYSEEIEITTPMLKLAAGIESGSLQGKEQVRAYWQKALTKIPDLHFELIEVTSGVDSVALYYKSVMNKMAIEVMFFDENGLVNKIIAHYTDL
jgi:ketosteroid isomerase-like protein